MQPFLFIARKKRIFITLTSVLLVFALVIGGIAFVFNDRAIADIKNDLSEKLDTDDNDYRSRTEMLYRDINGEDVKLYTLYRDAGEEGNNPNFAQAVMIYQCMKYKEKHPDEDVTITITSFHFSVVLAACVIPGKSDYGHLMNMYDKEFDSSTGYYRLSYLLVEAAKMGIEVVVVGQLDANPVLQANGTMRADGDFNKYFTAALDDKAYIEGKTVGDFMLFRKANWTSYGDKSATDMMHNKTCTVSHYIDSKGVEHGAAVWTGSINIDGVNYKEQNGNDSIQTGVVITGHEELRRIIYNYTIIMTEYCGQEEMGLFRNKVVNLNKQQIDLISAGRESEIPTDEQIVYLGSEDDPVFELYFTPFGGPINSWNTKYNPYCKYIAKLAPASRTDEYIEFIWINVKYLQSFGLASTMMEQVANAFGTSRNPQNNLLLQLPGLDEEMFNSLGLKEGKDIGLLSINKSYEGYHTKDVQLSYVEDGKRYFVTLYNSLNMHEGSMNYQTNTMLVVKESADVGNNFYIDYAALITRGQGLEVEPRRIKGFGRD